MVALGAVRTGVKLGNVHIFAYYRGALRTIVEKGLLTFLRRTSTSYLTRAGSVSILGRAPTPNACYGAGRTGARPWDARRRRRLKHRMRKMLPVAEATGTSAHLILDPAAGSAVGCPRTSWVLGDRARWRGREDQNSEDHGG